MSWYFLEDNIWSNRHLPNSVKWIKMARNATPVRFSSIRWCWKVWYWERQWEWSQPCIRVPALPLIGRVTLGIGLVPTSKPSAGPPPPKDVLSLVTSLITVATHCMQATIISYLDYYNNLLTSSPCIYSCHLRVHSLLNSQSELIFFFKLWWNMHNKIFHLNHF